MITAKTFDLPLAIYEHVQESLKDGLVIIQYGAFGSGVITANCPKTGVIASWAVYRNGPATLTAFGPASRPMK